MHNLWQKQENRKKKLICSKCGKLKEAEDDCNWRTVNGTPVCFKDGEDPQDSIDKAFSGKDTKNDIKTSLQNRGLKGDNLDTQLDKVDHFKDAKAKINDDGTITVYHHTNKDAKDKILDTGKIKGAEDGVFFTTKKNGQASGFGDNVVTAKIPIELLDIDDDFGDELHLRIPTEKRGQNVDISKFISN